MLSVLRASAVRFRLIAGRLLTRLGLGEDSFLVLLAVAVGIVTAGAAVGFHELIDQVRDLCYGRLGGHFDLYRRHLWMLVLLPAAGGLVVGVISQYVYRGREGAGVIDVMESVVRSTGTVKARSAIERIVTSAVTIGTGGSAGAEGPIVTIGAAIATAVGRVFGIARQQLPVLTGCGTAAGISAIFNSPIGGVLFTLEVILQDFSIRTFAPVVIASVIANVTTQAIFHRLHPAESFQSIFQVPADALGVPGVGELSWASVPNFLMLGLLCGAVGVAQTRLMHFTERRFSRLQVPAALKPAIGGLALGLGGAFYIVVFGWFMMEGTKPISISTYPMPAFYGDGYGVVQIMLSGEFFDAFTLDKLAPLLTFLLVAKLVGTCATLGSGGSGGVIAPSLFLGACGGALLGVALQRLGWLADVQPQFYALIGMGAVLAAVVHAPLAAILITLDVTQEPGTVLPAMLACIVATGFARLAFRDSIYTLGLRERGLRQGTVADVSLLRRLSVEQVTLEPAVAVRGTDPFQRVLDLTAETGAIDFVVIDAHGNYAGMVVMDDIKTVLLEREAVPLLNVNELMRTNVPLVRNTDDLAGVLDVFTRHDVSHLPVCVKQAPTKVIGLISRVGLMRRYQSGLAETR